MKAGPKTQLNNENIYEWDPMIHLEKNESDNPWALSARWLTKRVPPQLTQLTAGPIDIYDHD